MTFEEWIDSIPEEALPTLSLHDAWVAAMEACAHEPIDSLELRIADNEIEINRMAKTIRRYRNGLKTVIKYYSPGTEAHVIASNALEGVLK